jgi:hypothetical protein
MLNYFRLSYYCLLLILPAVASDAVVSKVVDHKLDEAHGKKIMVKPHVAVAQPTKSTPIIHDGVAHHPRLSYQAYDFPSRNPSPTTPILLTANLAADPSFASEAQLAAEQNKAKETAGVVRSITRKAAVRSSVQESPRNHHQKSSIQSDNLSVGSKKATVEKERPDWNKVYDNAIRVYYGEHGRRVAVAKKK